MGADVDPAPGEMFRTGRSFSLRAAQQRSQFESSFRTAREQPGMQHRDTTVGQSRHILPVRHQPTRAPGEIPIGMMLRVIDQNQMD